MSDKPLTAKQGVDELLKPDASIVEGLLLLRRINEVSTAIMDAKIQSNTMD